MDYYQQTYKIANQQLSAQISSYGATILSLTLNVAGTPRQLLLTTENSELIGESCLNAIAGRVAGRISEGRFKLGSQTYQLDLNHGPHHLHGGFGGFHLKQWQLVKLEDDAIHLKLLSPDLDQSYPGNLEVNLSYQLKETALLVSITAVTDRATPVNLTWHSYFNLDEVKTTIHQHQLTMASDYYVAVDQQGIPLSSELTPVANSPFDFRQAKLLTADLLQDPALCNRGGLDHNFALNKSSKQLLLTSSDRSLTLEVTTNQPSIVIYTAQHLNYSAIALETQNFINLLNPYSIEQPWLKPGEVYRNSSSFNFIVN